MRTTARSIVTVALATLCACNPAPPPAPAKAAAAPVVDAGKPAPPPPTVLERAVLLGGTLPAEVAETPMLKEKCEVCHTLQYLTQQRLTRPQWQKTIDKMRKFGAALSDDESARVVAFAAANFTRDLPPRTFDQAPLPPGSLPPTP